MLPPGTKKTAANTFDSEWMPVKPITIQNEAAKSQATSFSQDENYRAYKFFSIVDFDNAGSINPRKLFKLLFGDFINTFTAVFTHQDTGVVWGLDEDDQVCIAQLEDGSPASLLPTLVDKLRLLRVNNLKVPPLGGGVTAIRTVRAAIKQIRRGKVIFEFLEPSLTISPFCRYIDIEVEGLEELQTVELPVGTITPPPPPPPLPLPLPPPKYMPHHYFSLFILSHHQLLHISTLTYHYTLVRCRNRCCV